MSREDYWHMLNPKKTHVKEHQTTPGEDYQQRSKLKLENVGNKQAVKH